MSSGYSRTSIAAPCDGGGGRSTAGSRRQPRGVHRIRAVMPAIPVPVRGGLLGREPAARGRADIDPVRGLRRHVGVESQRVHEASPFLRRSSQSSCLSQNAQVRLTAHWLQEPSHLLGLRGSTPVPSLASGHPDQTRR